MTQVEAISVTHSLSAPAQPWIKATNYTLASIDTQQQANGARLLVQKEPGSKGVYVCLLTDACQPCEGIGLYKWNQNRLHQNILNSYTLTKEPLSPEDWCCSRRPANQLPLIQEASFLHPEDQHQPQSAMLRKWGERSASKTPV